jgi:GT2 family glycosyltransferase
MTITIAIPTYNRGAILVETIERLLALTPRADAILIADQTKQQPTEIEQRLRAWNDDGAIRWMRLAEPSIPKSMNDALEQATTELMLFFDDDLIPDAHIVEAHADAHKNAEVWAVAGQVLQPGEEPWECGGSAPLSIRARIRKRRRCLTPTLISSSTPRAARSSPTSWPATFP